MAIDEKKLIDDLEEVFKEHYYRLNNSGLSNELKRFINLQDRVAKVIFDQPKLSLETKTSDKWIPVTERLPEENKEVLIQIWYGTMTVGCLSDNRWISEAWPYQIHEVAAWMPLPLPYKGK